MRWREKPSRVDPIAEVLPKIHLTKLSGGSHGGTKQALLTCLLPLSPSRSATASRTTTAAMRRWSMRARSMRSDGTRHQNSGLRARRAARWYFMISGVYRILAVVRAGSTRGRLPGDLRAQVG